MNPRISTKKYEMSDDARLKFSDVDNGTDILYEIIVRVGQRHSVTETG